MVKKIVEELTDDLDGGPADRRTTFSLDNMHWEIDLSAANRDALEEALSEYMRAGRRLKKSRGGQGDPPASTPPDALATRAAKGRRSKIREWARKNGHVVGDRGRIPADVESAYYLAHNEA